MKRCLYRRGGVAPPEKVSEEVISLGVSSLPYLVGVGVPDDPYAVSSVSHRIYSEAVL